MGKAKLYGPLAMLVLLGLSLPLKTVASQEHHAGRVGTAAGVVAPTTAPAGWSIVLHDGVNFKGRRMSYTAPRSDLPELRPATRSVTIGGGVWELCSGPHFTGHCMTIARSAAHVGSPALGFHVRSLRPLAPRGP